MAGRVILAIGALIPLYGAYELLFAHGLWIFQWGMAPFIVMGLIVLGLGLFFLSIAIFSGSRTVTIDRGRRVCVVEFDGTFGLRWRFVHPFSTIGVPRALPLSTSEGPPHWGVQLPREGGKPIMVESYPDEARAKAEAEVIAAYIAAR